MYRILALSLFLLVGCHPLSMFAPATIKPSKIVLTSTENPKSVPIDVAVDNYGIPFIKANTIEDAFYALGFMHARDRLFQLDVTRHAALGRTAELFGERSITYDRRLRLLTYRLDEQLDHMTTQEKTLLGSYVRGINDSAKQRGRSAEHFILGVKFEDFTMRDVIAIARLQTWTLGADLFSEITRLRVARSDANNDAKLELLGAVDDRGVAIVSDRPQLIDNKEMVMPSYLQSQKSSASKDKAKFDVEEVVQTSGGASNAWVVRGELAKDGHAIMMNDPHLQHNWPSNFYLATLSVNDSLVTGATFVGLPGVVIGANKKISWGVTASLLNTQDTVLLTPSATNPQNYVVDGKELSLTPWPQKFCLNKRGRCSEEMVYYSIFGPVIDHSFDAWIDEHDRFAVQWTGFNVAQHAIVSGGFVELAQANTVSEAVALVQKMTFPGVNLVLADTAGNIGYAYAGLVPKRDPSQNPFLPLDGSKSQSLWRDFLAADQKPSVVNPPSGYLITANQNIYGHNTGIASGYAQQGAPPYRALRIKERIESVKDRGIDFDELSSIQLDETSVEAKELSAFLGAKCKEAFVAGNASRKEFAQVLADFDGRFTTDSLGALPFEMLTRELSALHLKAILGAKTPESMAYVGQVRFAVKNALLKEIQGQKTALFNFTDPKQNLDTLLHTSCESAYLATKKKAGTSSWSWRWGRHHYLQRQSPLARAPIIGSMFKDKKREVAGTWSAPLAEAGTPVVYGANLRFRAKMTSPQPQIFAVIDSGNSGTPGDKNAFDQAELWHSGKSIEIVTDWTKAQAQAAKTFQLLHESR